MGGAVLQNTLAGGGLSERRESRVNGERAKSSRVIRVGDELRIRRGPYECTIVVKDVSRLRGPAIHAQALYEETAESIRKREAAIERPPEFDSAGRPSKKDRSAIAKFTKRGW